MAAGLAHLGAELSGGKAGRATGSAGWLRPIESDMLLLP